MNFTDALTALLAGKRLRRPTWAGLALFIHIAPNQRFVSLRIGRSAGDPSLPGASASDARWSPYVEDLQAADWVEVGG
jgi:hypothetical protein